jgi:hypothetical protein
MRGASGDLGAYCDRSPLSAFHIIKKKGSSSEPPSASHLACNVIQDSCVDEIGSDPEAKAKFSSGMMQMSDTIGSVTPVVFGVASGKLLEDWRHGGGFGTVCFCSNPPPNSL